MKNIKKITNLLAFLLLAMALSTGTLLSCSDGDSGNNNSGTTGTNTGGDTGGSDPLTGGSDSTGYSIEFNEDTDSLSVNVDEEITLTIKSSKGTWKISEENTDSAIEVTETKNDAGELTGYKIKGVSEKKTADLYLYPEESAKDDSYDVTLKINVCEPYYTLTLTLDSDVAAKAASITVYAEGKEDGETEATLKQTVTAAYTARQTTATAKLEKAKANSYYYFNNIVVTVKDSDGNEIDVEANPVYFCYSATSGDGYLDADGIKIALAKASKTFTLSFEGFTIPGGSVTGLKYSTKFASFSSDWEEDTTFTPEVTVASDGASATFEVENTKEFYIDWTLVKIKDSSDDEISISAGNTESNKWYSYSGEFWSNTLTHVSGTYQNLVDNKSFSASSAYVQVLEASEFENISISTLKVVVKISSASEWWASASSDDSWAEETYQTLVWSDDESGYAGVITAESFIEALKTNGLYLNVKEDAVGAVSVSYIVK